MGTRGSVIPLFIEQIKNNKLLTVTNLEMTRFLMSVEQSVDLVFYALKNAKAGDILVQKSPACTINSLINVEKLFIKNIKIKNVGIRHGEKMHETLVSELECRCTNKKIFYNIKDNRELNYDKYFEKGQTNYHSLKNTILIQINYLI